MEKAIEQLEEQVQELAKLCSDLYDENTSIKTDQRLVEKECDQLREKNRIARGRVEQIVERLKG
ncbi:MAG: DUF904 domain-containing protein, partial [Proteobacteria bacterium]|nr:DUF904 domain-containing protein [Pseudomonadota bacterium]